MIHHSWIHTYDGSIPMRSKDINMNINALKAAEKSFLNKYPGGFRHPDLVEIGKKHKMEQLEKLGV